MEFFFNPRAVAVVGASAVPAKGGYTILKNLVNGFRGSLPVDRDMLAQILVSLGELGQRFPRIREIDINPLIINDGKPIAVDATNVVYLSMIFLREWVSATKRTRSQALIAAGPCTGMQAEAAPTKIPRSLN